MNARALKRFVPGGRILTAAGNSPRPLIYLAWASVTNIVLDLVFIVISRMGVAGPAIATGPGRVDQGDQPGAAGGTVLVDGVHVGSAQL